MSYVLIQCQSKRETCKAVNEMLSRGYRPIGGISVAIHEGYMYYTQAMLKDDSD